MILYGVKVDSDIQFPLSLAHQTEIRYEMTLSFNVPQALKDSIICCGILYRSHGRLVVLCTDRVFEDSEARQPFCYEVQDIVKFYWQAGSTDIYYEMQQRCNADLLSFWFSHLFLPFYFTLERMYDFLHAGAVEVEGKPILFIAPSMGGKSTLTDYFIRKGHTMISDDKVLSFVENGHFMVGGSFPYHRPFRQLETLGYPVENFTASFKPLHAFYLLDRMEADAEVHIEEVTGFKKFDAILPNYLFAFKWLNAERLAYLSKMLNSTKVFRVQLPWDKQHLSKVHEKIIKHSGTLK